MVRHSLVSAFPCAEVVRHCLVPACPCAEVVEDRVEGHVEVVRGVGLG